ncbi:MAG: nicotinate (nicotinamide) nucleotide adenylyltransferase [Candidatus Kapabacteria bacterium]|nr:nicotinate (nicotinamide) nucleotide adenylyltransferase [Candidatus Kapabacteria bacterium]
MKIGIYGGSFNPLHNAHIVIAGYFYNYFSLDKVLFVPAYQSPFKQRSFYQIPDLHRLKMLEIALSGYKHFEIEKYELNHTGVSFTIDTIKYLQNQYPDNTEFYLLIGADQSAEFHRWKSWQEILKSVKLCVAGRDDIKKLFVQEVDEYCRINKIIIEYPDTPILDISSQSVREKILAGETIDDIVPEQVKNYIFQNKLYKE